MKTKPSQFLDDQEFLKAFCEGLRKSNGHMSMRNLCRRLKWPSSYISDLMAGRKRLSASKAMSFAAHFEFSEFETEYLLFLVLQKSKSKEVRQFATVALEERKQSRFLEDGDRDWDWLYSDPDFLALYLVISDWSGTLSAQKIVDRFLATPSIDEQKVESFISKLKNIGAMEETPDGPRLVSKLRHQDRVVPEDQDRDVEAAYHRLYAENFIRFLKTKRGPALMNAGPIRVRWRDFLEYQKRILSLRNWMMSRSEASAGLDADELIYMQYDMNLFPICHPKLPEDWGARLREADRDRVASKV